MAILASYMNDKVHGSLDKYLNHKLSPGAEVNQAFPKKADVAGFDLYLERYKNGLAIQQAAIDHF